MTATTTRMAPPPARVARPAAEETAAMTSVPDQPTLWETEPTPDGYQRPPHINPAKCGITGTNYGRGCRCQPCVTHHQTYHKRLRSGQRTCLGCGNAFTPSDHRQKHCGKACKRIRTCKVCYQRFTVNENGAGWKYCSEECKYDPERGYNNYRGSGHNLQQIIRHVTCQICGAEHEHQGNPIKWDACPDCVRKLRPFWAPGHGRDSSLTKHRVSGAMVRKLLNNPNCEICGIDLTTKSMVNKAKTIALVVDHDHNCCPRNHSCGNCVRGFICRRCNSALGLINDNPANAQAMIAYLTKVLGNDQ